jgi:hypothetical protein
MVCHGTGLVPNVSFSHFTLLLKGQCTRFFASGFFLKSVSPKPLIIPLGPFRIFTKIRGDIRSLSFATGVKTPVANGKNLQAEKFNNFFWTPLGSRVNIYIHFCLQVHFKVSAA